MMLRRLLLAGMLAVAAWTAPAQETRPTDGEVQAELQPAVALAHRVERMKRAWKSGDDVQVQVAAQEVELLRRRYGTLDLTPFVEAAALWARELGQEGQADLGLKVLHDVENRWAPRHPTLLGTRIILHRSTGLKGTF